MLTNQTKAALALAIRTGTWLGNAPAELDGLDRLLDQYADMCGEAVEDAITEGALSFASEEERYEPDEEVHCLNALYNDECANWQHGKPDYADCCAIAMAIGDTFGFTATVDEETQTVTWGR